MLTLTLLETLSLNDEMGQILQDQPLWELTNDERKEKKVNKKAIEEFWFQTKK